MFCVEKNKFLDFSWISGASTDQFIFIDVYEKDFSRIVANYKSIPFVLIGQSSHNGIGT